MRVLLSGYSPRTHTSYGTIIRDLWTRLLKSGEIELAQHAWFNIPVLPSPQWQLYPTNTYSKGREVGFAGPDRYGEETFEDVLRKFQPDIVWCLSDVYMSRYLDRFKKRHNFKLVRWTLTEGVPIDKDNIPSLLLADKTVAITKFAAREWQNVTGEKFDVIYHGVDTEIFSPVPSEYKNEIRANTGGQIRPDDFVFSFIGVNQARKRPWLPFEILAYLRSGAWGWDEQGRPRLCRWDVLQKKFMKNPAIKKRADPVPAVMWCHSVDDGSRWNYTRLAQEWDVTGQVIYTAGLSKTVAMDTDEMAEIYRMSDAVHMVSGSEGFGMPTIEAAACGVPSVYTSYGALAEIGGICKGRPVGWITSEPAAVTHVRWVYPDTAGAVAEYYHLYKNRDVYSGEGYRSSLHNVVRQNFDAGDIAVQWMETLEEVHSRKTVVTVGEEI